MLGGFGVVVDGVTAGPWPTRRAVQLVALLALSPNHRLPTEQAMDALWPDLSPDAARANLHKTATLARQALGSKEAVVLKGDAVALWPGRDVTSDVATFERAATAALASADAGTCAAAATIHAGALLPEERYEEWTLAARERMARLHRDLLRAAGLWAELTEADPTDEPAHRQLMREQFEAGRLHAAIRQFQRLKTILDRDLGVLPSPETVALYRQVLGTAASGWVRPALVGREVELVRARAALRRAVEGRAAAIFVTGPPGIGKTRLCEELLDHVAGDGWLVLRAAGREQTSSVPYWPLVEAIQAVLVERPAAAEALGEAERQLLTRLAGLATGEPRVPIHRHTVLHLVGRVIDALGAPRTVLFIDDLQWVDGDSIDLAEVLASAPSPRGVLLLASYRSGSDGAAAAQAMVARGAGVDIELNPLTRAECDAIVADVLQRRGSATELDLAWELSEGNPFFALEVAAALSSDDATAAAGANGAVDVRLGRLPTATRDALRRVALLADQFTADEFAALVSVDADRALEHLDTAMAVGVIARQDGSYRFRHDLMGERLAASVPDGERASAHAAAAHRLVDLGAPPARIVHHLLAAGRDDDALPWLRRAAVGAIEVGAHADALAVIDRGLTIAPRDPALLALRADAMNGLADRGAAAAYAVAMAVTSDPERAALAVRRAKTLVYAGDIPAAVEALTVLTAVPPHAAGQLHVTWGLIHWFAGALDEADDAGRKAQRLAEETGSVRDYVDATMVRAMVAHQRSSWPHRVTLDLLDMQLRPDLAAVVIDAHLCLAESYLYGGVPYPEVVGFARDLLREARAAGAPRAEAVATTLLGEAQLLMGEIDEAADRLRAAAELHRRAGMLTGEALSLQRLAEALMAQGQQTDAQAALAGALTTARGTLVGTRHLLDRIHGTAIRTAAEPVTAVDEAARAIRGPAETCPPCSINFMVPAAIACADAGDVERATAYLAGSEQVAAVFFPRGGWQAALDEARAHLALAKGDSELATRLLTAAADALEHLGQRLDADRCRQDLAALTAGKV